MGDAAVQLEDVNRRFGVGNISVHALTDVTLSLESGTRIAVTGPSGSGKTTLLNLIGALDKPDTGIVRVLGETVSSHTERRASTFRREHVGFVFQDDALVPELTVSENVELPLVLLKRPGRERRDKVRAVLDRLGLLKRAASYPPLLSGGEKQRVAVARAVIHSPRILLADEPSANLDAAATEAVMQAIDDLADESGLTVLIATHDPRVFDRYGARLQLVDGRIIHGDQAP